MFHVPNKFRLRNHPTMASDDSYGNNGAFIIPIEHNVSAMVIASDEAGWSMCRFILLIPERMLLHYGKRCV